MKIDVTMERPSDIQGLLYMPFKDDVEEAKVTLAKELDAQGIHVELLRNLGDGRVQAASGCWLTASMPSMNFVPVISFGNWLWPSRRRQLFSAACASLKIMAIAV